VDDFGQAGGLDHDARGSPAALDAAQQKLAPVNDNPAATRRKDNS
jgi:hypothetical protein